MIILSNLYITISIIYYYYYYYYHHHYYYCYHWYYYWYYYYTIIITIIIIPTRGREEGVDQWLVAEAILITQY